MDQNTRPDFYESQYLGAEDLDGAVDYGRVQRARHGLGAHTWGIASGLELVERKLPSGGVEVAVMPGVAWDGYYRTLAVLAPTVIGAEKFANFLAATQPDGLLVPVWLRYAETAARPPAPGFAVCGSEGNFSRAVEGVAIEVGVFLEAAHGSVTIDGRSIDPLKARSAFIPGAPDLFDESVPHQTFPLSGNRPWWLVPLGYVRWQKLGAAPGRLIPRSDKVTPNDLDVSRAFRRYVGHVGESIVAADGLIRLCARDRDPAPGVSRVRLPLIMTDPKNPPENDLLWVEGNLHVLGDARVSGGKLELRNADGQTEGVPLALRRLPNGFGGRDLQVVLGAQKVPAGRHRLVVGPDTLDPVTGQLKENLAQCFVVRDDGTVGVGIDAPPQLLTLGGDKSTRLEFGRISGTLPWSGTNAKATPTKAGDGSFAMNMQAAGSINPDADFAIMRDRRQRLVLFNQNTNISSQDGDVIVSVNLGEIGEAEGLRVTRNATVGVGVAAPAAKLEVGGDIAIDKMAGGTGRPLPPGGTLIWNDGDWLRLNQNLDFKKPIGGVITPGLLASVSLNIGGLGPTRPGDWNDPKAGNATIAGKLAIGAFEEPEILHVKGDMRCTGVSVFDMQVIARKGLEVDNDIFGFGSISAKGNISADGDIFTGGKKFFVIPHPLAPDTKRLAHAAIEGPEAAVFYRGEGQLVRGRVTITLPSYFEALTRPERRTVQLTPILEDDDGDATAQASALAATRVQKGKFTVRHISKGNASQRFWWEVKAVRTDVSEVQAEIDSPAPPKGPVRTPAAGGSPP